MIIWAKILLYLTFILVLYRAFKHKQIYKSLVEFSILPLFVLQGIWVINDWKSVKYKKILYFSLTEETIFSSSLYIFIFTAIFVAANSYKVRSAPLHGLRLSINKSSRNRMFLLGLGSLLVAFGGVVLMVGGLKSFLINPGQNIPGQTLFILIATGAKIPLLVQIVSNNKIGKGEIILYALVFLFYLFNSRFLALFSLMNVLVAWDLFRRRVKLLTFLLSSFFLGLIVVFFGLYRDFSYRYETEGLVEFLEELRGFDIKYVIDWFFAFNLEGFLGLSNILYEYPGDCFWFDYGASYVALPMMLVPGQLKELDFFLFEWMEVMKNMFPVGDSVVPSAMEQMFGHFGLIGILTYPLVLALFMRRFRNLTNGSLRNKILAVLLLTHCIGGIRGDIIGILIFFGLADLIIVRFFFIKL